MIYVLQNFKDPNIKKYVRILLKNQKKNGSWDTGAFNFGHKFINKDSADGSDALTTAIALETLQKYSYQLTNPTDFIYQDFQSDYKKIEKTFKNWLKKQPKSIQQFLTQISSKILKQTFTIRSALLPFFYYNSISLNEQKRLDRKLLTDLGVNNIIGWIGYYLEDKILDENINDKNFHELANLCKQQFLLFFKTKFAKNIDFQKWLDKAEKTYEKTIDWELKMTRFKTKLPKNLPNYKNYAILADRSLPFTYSTAALATKLGYKTASAKFENLMAMLRHHLIIKQLNDDTRDIDEDLETGRITSIISLALKSGGTKDSILSEKLLRKVSELILKHINLSEKAAKSAKLKKPEVFLSINNGLLDSAKRLEHEVRILNAIS